MPSIFQQPVRPPFRFSDLISSIDHAQESGGQALADGVELIVIETVGIAGKIGDLVVVIGQTRLTGNAGATEAQIYIQDTTVGGAIVSFAITGNPNIAYAPSVSTGQAIQVVGIGVFTADGTPTIGMGALVTGAGGLAAARKISILQLSSD